uniref:Uncharacterized protein n=1 Tax=Octopus bimaculoides TaxID=37653 RepID=A0A0L8GMT8_OCTBM
MAETAAEKVQMARVAGLFEKQVREVFCGLQALWGKKRKKTAKKGLNMLEEGVKVRHGERM